MPQKAEHEQASLFCDTENGCPLSKQQRLRWGWMMYEMTVNDIIKAGSNTKNIYDQS